VTGDPAVPPDSAHSLLERLNAATHRFSAEDRETKAAALRFLEALEIPDADSLIALHESLCFLQAYPDDPEVLRLVEEHLGSFPARVDRLQAIARPADLKRLRDTGIIHTPVFYPYPYPIARWLATHFPQAVEIDWEDEAGIEKIRSFLPHLVHDAEQAALDDERLSLREWLRAVKGTREVSDLQCLLELLDRPGLSFQSRRYLYESAELLLRWELGDGAPSRTRAKVPAGRIFYHQGPLRRSGMDFPAEIRTPLPWIRAASPGTGERLLHAFRGALSVRNRELHPLNYANPEDVFSADGGRGLQIILVGMAPEHRLLLEGYYSFLVLKNGVPVSYGGGAALFDRLEIAGNIFESFRQGESVYLYTQVFRAYRRLCGSRHFLVERYQVGYENREALESGAFWFYHKLGFRPTDPQVLALSEAEHRRIMADPGYRSPREVLEQLAESDLTLRLDGEGEAPFQHLSLGRIGMLVTRTVSRRFAGDRAAAVRWARRRVCRNLGIPRSTSWSEPEQAALDRLSPILALIPDLPRWSPAEKRALVRIIRAKGGNREAPYIRLLRQHHRLARSLHALAN
jgi:hypothetical protein